MNIVLLSLLTGLPIFFLGLIMFFRKTNVGGDSSLGKDINVPTFLVLLIVAVVILLIPSLQTTFLESKRNEIYLAKSICDNSAIRSYAVDNKPSLSLRTLVESLRDAPNLTPEDAGTLLRSLNANPQVRTSILDHVLVYYDREGASIYCAIQRDSLSEDSLNKAQARRYREFVNLREGQ